VSNDSHYTVLARRFRPQTFDDVAGQEHVSKALRNAIRSGRVAHAYLFTGARGVGKTSMARILAKALNCPHVEDAVPCNECEICEGISAGNDVDVMEIDGASNRRIEDIRSIRANVGVRSMRTRFKVYIIDEVHMLTREAFNALLKTLEEPPPSVKFVFCTTEPEKIPDTILSRCQRFDFGTIEEGTIGDRLRAIAQAENFEVDDEAIQLVARRARGSMRDSQSLFDQLLAFSDGTITAADVHRMLGMASDELLTRVFDNIAQQRPGEVLNLLEEAFSGGVQPSELLDQCVAYLRDLIVLLSDGAKVRFCSVAESSRDVLADHAGQIGLPNLMAAFQILSETKSRIFRSTFARVLLEMALVQIALMENLSAISSLLSGDLPALPSSAPASVASDQKKTVEDESATDPAAADGPAASLKLAFSESSEAQILLHLVSRTPFTLSTALRQVGRLAISEPNQLELVLDSSYDFQRRVIEDSDNRSAIQEMVALLTGVKPVVTLRLTTAEPSAVRDAPSEPTSVATVAQPHIRSHSVQDWRSATVLRVDIDPDKDPFVQEVVEIFGAKVERVIDAPVKRNSGTAGEAAPLEDD